MVDVKAPGFASQFATRSKTSSWASKCGAARGRVSLRPDDRLPRLPCLHAADGAAMRYVVSESASCHRKSGEGRDREI